MKTRHNNLLTGIDPYAQAANASQPNYMQRLGNDNFGQAMVTQRAALYRYQTKMAKRNFLDAFVAYLTRHTYLSSCPFTAVLTIFTLTTALFATAVLVAQVVVHYFWTL